MALPYSERFSVGASSSVGVVDSYTVPANKRAIVSSFSVVDDSGTGGPSIVAIIGPGVGEVSLVGEASGTTVALLCPVHSVFYAGETLTVYLAAGVASWHLAGYLLSDPGA